MRARLTAVFLALGSAFAAPAQGQFSVGWRDLSIDNPTSSGSRVISARVHYPALAQGQLAPLLPLQTQRMLK